MMNQERLNSLYRVGDVVGTGLLVSGFIYLVPSFENEQLRSNPLFYEGLAQIAFGTLLAGIASFGIKDSDLEKRVKK